MRGHAGGNGLRTACAVVLVLVVTACATPPEAGTVHSGGGSSRADGDGSIPENESISLQDDDHPAIANLDPALLAAARAAAVDAAARGVELKVTSGWRSKRYQQRLLDEATARYRSAEEARKLVHPPEKSKHVTGHAIDIGPTAAADWLVQHGADHGLCQAFANEMWHFELLTSPGGQCPQPQGTALG
ncbi:M15 family metallopeptidase [Lentzea chajnantorensis]